MAWRPAPGGGTTGKSGACAGMAAIRRAGRAERERPPLDADLRPGSDGGAESVVEPGKDKGSGSVADNGKGAAPGAAFREGFVEADGFRIRYAEAGEGAPLVHLHGAGGLRLSRTHDLLAREFRVNALEMTGFGV